MAVSQNGYQNLDVWQKALTLVPVVFKFARKLPKVEHDVLCNPMREAVVAIPSNIAESRGRRTRGGVLKHLDLAQGALARLNTLLIISFKLDYLTERELHIIHPRLHEIGLLLSEMAIQELNRQ